MANQFDNRTTLLDQGLRAVFMLVFWIVSRFVLFLVLVLAAFQLVSSLVLGKPNEKILDFGKGLSRYVAQIVDFLMYNSEQKPWPFQEWPASSAAEEKEVKKQ